MNVYTPPTGCDTCDNHQPDIYTAANISRPALDIHRILHDNLRELFNPIAERLERHARRITRSK